jgi:CPA2 family monovalent cation:H+ antiporter-2
MAALTPTTLELVLILLAAAVFVAALFRQLKLPAMLGYLIAGIALAPWLHAWLPEESQTRHLAEFGVVFLMFSIGLEFSLPQLSAMRATVFGFGGAQVGLTMLSGMAAALGFGLPWTSGVVLGGVLAMSSTAIVSKMLAERLELQSPHGRRIMGVLLFQDLAVVPLLILIPALAGQADDLPAALGFALLKTAVALALILVVGQKLIRPWFHVVARQRSSELFMLNVLLFTLGLAYLTERAGLSLALGAFLAGMLISETEYRYQVEDDIKPFRDVLLGLFFVTVGMMLDPGEVIANWAGVLLVVLGLMLGKALLIAWLGHLSGHGGAVGVRTALGLAQGGEFGFVLLALAAQHAVLEGAAGQVVLAGIVISMLLAPIVIHNGEAVVRRVTAEWTGQAVALTDIAAHSFGVEGHVIVCGYGRSGQNLARLLAAEGIAYIALDNDLQRVRAAAAAGESVVFGDAGRREVLSAAGLKRARALVVTFAETPAALRILAHIQTMRPELPVIVRTVDDAELDRLRTAGATEVVPEVLEGSLMLASHALVLLGVPLARVLRRLRTVREARYGLLRGYFHGATDLEEEDADAVQPRLGSVLMTPGAHGVGRVLGDLHLDELLVDALAVRRHGIRGDDPPPGMSLEAGDVLVLRGAPEALAAAEIRLLQG